MVLKILSSAIGDQGKCSIMGYSPFSFRVFSHLNECFVALKDARYRNAEIEVIEFIRDYLNDLQEEYSDPIISGIPPLINPLLSAVEDCYQNNNAENRAHLQSAISDVQGRFPDHLTQVAEAAIGFLDSFTGVEHLNWGTQDQNEEVPSSSTDIPRINLTLLPPNDIPTGDLTPSAS